MCKDHDELTGTLDCDAGYTGLTGMLIPFGDEKYQGKPFFVGEGKYVVGKIPGQPWYEYSNALAAQVFGSMMGHDAPLSMIYLVEGVKFFYRVPVSSAEGSQRLFELWQYPAGPGLLHYTECGEITDILMEIARIGARHEAPDSWQKHEAVIAAFKKRHIEEMRSQVVGRLGKKSRTSSQATASFDDKEISFKPRSGELVTFTSLDLVSCLGKAGVRELKEELQRRREQELDA